MLLCCAVAFCTQGAQVKYVLLAFLFVWVELLSTGTQSVVSETLEISSGLK